MVNLLRYKFFESFLEDVTPTSEEIRSEISEFESLLGEVGFEIQDLYASENGYRLFLIRTCFQSYVIEAWFGGFKWEYNVLGKNKDSYQFDNKEEAVKKAVELFKQDPFFINHQLK
jgi:hypothetical protein